MNQIPAGWYPDPRHEASHRWWDGTAWTSEVGDGGGPPPSGGARSASEAPAPPSDMLAEAPNQPPAPGDVTGHLPMPGPAAAAPPSFTHSAPPPSPAAPPPPGPVPGQTSPPPSGIGPTPPPSGVGPTGLPAAPPTRKRSSTPLILAGVGIIAVIAIIAVVALNGSGGDGGGGSGARSTSGTGDHPIAVDASGVAVHEVSLAPGELALARITGDIDAVNMVIGIDAEDARVLSSRNDFATPFARLAADSDTMAAAFLSGSEELSNRFDEADTTSPRPIPGYDGIFIIDLTGQGAQQGYWVTFPIESTIRYALVSGDGAAHDVTLQVCTRKNPSIDGAVPDGTYGEMQSQPFYTDAQTECLGEMG